MTAMTAKTAALANAPSEALLLEIATKHLHGIETLETRNSDSLDFHDVAIWAIRARWKRPMPLANPPPPSAEQETPP